MANLGFPSNPTIGQTYTIGIRTWIWNGNGWQLQTSITSYNPLTVTTEVITSATNSTSTTTGALTVAGGIGIGEDIYVGGTVTANTVTANTITAGTIIANALIEQSVTIGTSLFSSYVSNSITSATTVTLDSFPLTSFRTAKYLIQVVDHITTGSDRVEVTDLILFHDDNGINTVVDLTEFGYSSNTGELATLDATCDGINVTLTVTPLYTPANMVVKLIRMALAA